MDHYLTTYKKDYLWPNALEGPKGGNTGPFQGSRPDAKGIDVEFLKACTALAKQAECKCPSNAGPGKSTPGHDEQHWSRAQIMGPLLDPKLFPVKVCAAPESVSSRYNQPNAFLDKLQSKFPMLYKVLQSDASPELKQRIERDRNTTTYQVDFCNSGPGAQLESLQRAAGESGLGPCSPPVRLPGDPCRVQQKPRTGTNRSFTKSHAGAADARAKCETTAAMPPLGRSEYQDGVAKLGALIMRDKLHRRN